MTILIAAIVATVLLLLVLMLTRRGLSLHRSVLLHAPAPLAWRHIENFPELLAAHGRGRTLGAFGQHAFVKGDPHSGGSVWRTVGRWGDSEYWVDAELIEIEAGRQIVLRLIRDSLHTQHGLRGHVARLTLQPNGAGTCKLTWDLQARFRPTRLLWHRHYDRSRLKARLLDLCLRSVKVFIDNASADHEADAGKATRPTTDHETENSSAVGPSPPPPGSAGPYLHPH